MPSDNASRAKGAAMAAARQARAENAAAIRTAMNVGRQQHGRANAQATGGATWGTAVVLIMVLIGMLFLMMRYSS